MAEMVDQLSDGQTEMSDQVADMINNGMAQGTPQGGGQLPSLSNNEAGIVTKARDRAQSVTSPQ